MSKENEYSNEELLNIIRSYHENVGFPTQRAFKNSNGLPSYVTFYNRFGSFKNAILMSGINIPPERERYFNREKLSDEEMLHLLKYYTQKKSELGSPFLLTLEEINNIDAMPSSSTYISRFGGIIESYKMIMIDYEKHNKEAMKIDMIKKYKLLCEDHGGILDSRQIDDLSKQDLFYCTKAITNAFGTLNEFQIECGYTPNNVGLNKTREEMIDDLKMIGEELGKPPHRYDLVDYPNVASETTYYHEFGSYVTALKLAGFDSSKVLTTPNGIVCKSQLEYKFARMLETKGITFKKDVRYSEYIVGLDKRYTFDFVVQYGEKELFFEIFGIEGVESYDNRKNEKLMLCKKHNINLISLSKDMFWSKTYDNLFQSIVQKAVS